MPITTIRVGQLRGVAQGSIPYDNGATQSYLSPGSNYDLFASGGASANPQWLTPTGVANQITVTPSAGLLTFSLPATPHVTGLQLSGLTASQPVVSDASKNLVSQSFATFAGNLTAAGDVTGALSANTVAKIQGNAVKAASPTDGQLYVWVNANSRFEPLSVSGDATLAASGVLTISALAVTGSKIAASTVTDSNLATSYIKADGTRAFSGPISIGGNAITNLADPTNAQDAASKNYVDTVLQGLSAKTSCRVATTANITLSGAQTIDGVSVIAGNRVLVKDQSSGAQNGLYLCAAGSWTRTVDCDVAAEFIAAYVWIDEGTVNADTGWIQTTIAPITVGTTAIAWTQFSGAAMITAGTGLTKTGNTLSITNTAVTPASYGDAAHTVPYTVNAQGQLTAAASTLIAIAASQVTSGQLALTQGGSGADLSGTGGANQIVRQNSSGGAFTVSALAAADIPNLAASKITSGQLAIAQGGTNAATFAANQGFFGPTSGSAAAPSVRALVAADIPNLDTSILTTGLLPLARGGTAAALSGANRVPWINATNNALTSDGGLTYGAVGGATLLTLAPSSATATALQINCASSQHGLPIVIGASSTNAFYLQIDTSISNLALLSQGTQTGGAFLKAGLNNSTYQSSNGNAVSAVSFVVNGGTSVAQIAAAAAEAQDATHLGTGLLFGVTPTGNSAMGNVWQITSQGSLAWIGGSVTTSAVDKFFYPPACPGAPSGTPTSQANAFPMVGDSTNGVVNAFMNSFWSGVGTRMNGSTHAVNYTMLSTDCISVMTVTGKTFSLTVAKNKVYFVIYAGAGGSVTVKGVSGTVNGAATVPVTQGGFFWCDGTNFNGFYV